MDKLLGGVLRMDGLAGGSRQLGDRRMVAENVAPKRLGRRTLERDYLCMGIDSPCHRCEVRCHYGRLYLQIKAKGKTRHG